MSSMSLIFGLTTSVCCLTGTCIVCTYFEVYSLLFIIILSVFGSCLLRYYLPAKRNLFRLAASTKAPVISYISQTFQGVATLRAYSKEKEAKTSFARKLNDNFVAVLCSSCSSLWFELMLECGTFLFVAFLIIYMLFHKDSFSAVKAGLLIANSIALQQSLLAVLNSYSELENLFVSLERTFELNKLPKEKSPASFVGADWPRHGKIQFIDFTVGYSVNESILNNVNFTIESREKITIMGRTGSGKSTLFLSLFRILESQKGQIYIDDYDISKIDVEVLRNNITIIPQSPLLFKDTLRFNVDPSSKQTDKRILEVFDILGFPDFVESRGGLMAEIDPKSLNISNGERQIICIVRAVLKVVK